MMSGGEPLGWGRRSLGNLGQAGPRSAHIKIDSHPYDDPWAQFKVLRQEVNDLRAALLAEQQQRAAEVLDLRAIITKLCEDQKKNHHEVKNDIMNVSQDVVMRDKERARAIEDIKTGFRQSLTE